MNNLLIIVLILVVAVPAQSAVDGLRSSRKLTSLLCHITLEFVSTREPGTEPHRQQQHYECSPVENGSVSDYSYTLDLPADFVEENKDQLLAGTLFANIPMGQIVNGAVVYPFNSAITIGAAPESFQNRRRRLSASSGTRSVLVLRISSNDASPDYSAQQYHNYIFSETNFTQPTLKSQYNLLSFGKLNIVPTKYGVMEVKVNMNANGATSMAIRDAAIQAVTSKYSLSTITDLADHVMLCIPPGTGDWAGSSPVNSWRLVLNNQWCGFVSALMHEMGHNLGLLHSNVGSTQYLDFSSYMSAGYATPYFPAKSFNGANNWQLGWYSDRQVAINPASGGQVVTLATFVDYGKSNKQNPVLVKVGDGLFLQYNRAKSFNYQAQQNVDQVTIVAQLTNGTNLLGGVDLSSPQLIISNFDGTGRKLVIHACKSGAGTSSNPDWMDISIGYDQNYCNQATTVHTSASSQAKPASTPARTIFNAAQSPAKAPVSSPTKFSSCKDGVRSYTVSGHGTKTCTWLRLRPVWQNKLCSLQKVRTACPKTCGACS